VSEDEIALAILRILELEKTVVEGAGATPLAACLSGQLSHLRGKRVVLVDDSLVRGTTSRKIVRLVRDAGAAEVHLRLSSPPIVNPCVYGIDTPERSELLAANLDLAAITAFVGADSVGYLSVEGMHEAAGLALGGACHACFGGPYPVQYRELRQRQRRLFEKERR